MPPEVTVGELYAHQATPAALACTREVLDRMRVDPGYVGVPLAGCGDEVRGRFRSAVSLGRFQLRGCEGEREIFELPSASVRRGC